MWKAVCARWGWRTGDNALRHAVTVQALGMERSSNDFSPRDWDRIFAQLAILQDDLDLAAQIERIAYTQHDAAQAAHVPEVQPGKPRRQGQPARTTPSRYERTTRTEDPGERRRLLWFISRLFQPELIRHLSVDLYDLAAWEDLDIPRLTQLRDALRNRLSKWLTRAKLDPRAHGLPRGVPVAPGSRTGRPTNEAYITALLARGIPVDMRDDLPEEGDPF